MNRYVTKGIILRRTNFGEADRILQVYTNDHGMVSLIAKGCRKSGSKLAGGVEPFTINELTIMEGRGDIQSLISSRSCMHFERIASDIERIKIASMAMKRFSIFDSDPADMAQGFRLLSDLFEWLNEIDSLELVRFVFELRHLELLGQTPDLYCDASGEPLSSDSMYIFDSSGGSLVNSQGGRIGADEIKFARIALNDKLQNLQRIIGYRAMSQTWLDYFGNDLL